MRIVMLTDDVQIDRRILLEAESLYAQGHEVILLAEEGVNTTPFEFMGNIKVERVQYPAHSVGESYFLKILALTNVGLSRLSALVLKSISFMARMINALFCKLSVAASKSFSLAIRLNQRLGQMILTWARRARQLPLHERALLDRIVFYAPDVIHAHDLPRLRVAAKAKKRLAIPLVYDAHELYPEIATLTASQKQKLSRGEKRYIKQADTVITVNEFIAEEMAVRYQITRPQVILNATKWPEKLRQDRHWDRFRERFNISKEHKILLFQGWMSATRGLQPLVRAMKEVPEHLHLVFMGYGEAREELEAITAQEGLEARIHFMDAVPQEELLSWTSSADAGIIPYQPIDLNTYYCSPNKLFEFIQAELPIIANDLPFLRKVVVGNEFGVVHRLDSTEDYAKAIGQMFDMSGPGPDGFRASLCLHKHEFCWEKEGDKLLKIYESLQHHDRLSIQLDGPVLESS